MVGSAPWWKPLPITGPPYQRMSKEAADHWCEGYPFPLAWRQAEPHSTIVGCSYLRKFCLPPPEEAARPHSPRLTFLCFLEAEEIHRVQITHVPFPRKSGFNLEALRSHG